MISVTHSPPLAYSITRYKVFSVSITSKSLTGVGERGTDSGFKGGRKKMSVELQQEMEREKGRSSGEKGV